MKKTLSKPDLKKAFEIPSLDPISRKKLDSMKRIPCQVIIFLHLLTNYPLVSRATRVRETCFRQILSLHSFPVLLSQVIRQGLQGISSK